eukprot:CAMPEP_0113576564 /NCGR_PEP_ID=MMETSP0015_2-20120614/28366_1 /TAXON_ID=2838 /ORGANISM="Odontella" /LENGTH=323 /DNA_ID=CAMNT_0000480013 /DNA_START=107 /DNA_END=1075 /DNA_ORIENTATION=- /assembly_acc=CAM_ASM_000160
MMSAHRYTSLSLLLLQVLLIALPVRGAYAIDGQQRDNTETEVVVTDQIRNQMTPSNRNNRLIGASSHRSLPADGTESSAGKKCLPFYPYSFGGLDKMSVANSVALLQRTGHAGIAVRAGNNADRKRLARYYKVSRSQGGKFNVIATFMSHKFKKLGTSIKNHKATINAMAGREGVLWVFFRDDNGDISPAELEKMVRKIVRFADRKGVRVALYPHVNNIYSNALDGIKLVEKINRSNFGIVLNLNHELLAGKFSELAQTVERIKHKLFGVNISGARWPLDDSSDSAMIRSSVLALDENEFDLKSFLSLIKNSGYSGPIGFLNY